MVKVHILVIKHVRPTKLIPINLRECLKANQLNNPCLSPNITTIQIRVYLDYCTLHLSIDQLNGLRTCCRDHEPVT